MTGRSAPTSSTARRPSAGHRRFPHQPEQLPWGHDEVVVEENEAAIPVEALPRFNGATTKSSWKR
jgi:hypothetical protein